MLGKVLNNGVVKITYNFSEYEFLYEFLYEFAYVPKNVFYS